MNSIAMKVLLVLAALGGAVFASAGTAAPDIRLTASHFDMTGGD